MLKNPTSSPARAAPAQAFAAAAFALALAACGDPDLRRGDDALGLGRYDVAIEAYEAARQRLPAGQIPEARLASAHRAAAMGLMERGQCGEARPHLALAERLTKPVLIDYQQLYECDAGQNAPVELQVQDLERLLVLGDHRASVLRKLMQYELDQARDAQAADHMEMLEKRSVLTLDERKQLAQVLLRLDRRDQAWSHLKVTVEREPHDPINRLKLAELAEERGERELARSIYERLIAEFPENVLAWLRLAEFRGRCGDVAGASQAQARADALRNGKLPPPQEMRPLLRSRR